MFELDGEMSDTRRLEVVLQLSAIVALAGVGGALYELVRPHL